MLSSSESFDDDTVDTATYSLSQDPDGEIINSVNTNTNIVPTAFSYASPFPFTPTFFYQSQSPEPFIMEHIFREMGLIAPSDSTFQGHMSSANVKFGCSALVNVALRDMLAASCTSEEETNSTSTPRPNGIFTLFGSPIFPSTPGFNFRSGGLHFLGNLDLLPPFFYPNMQANSGPPISNPLTPICKSLEALASTFQFAEPITSTSRFPEPLSSGSPLLMEPLVSGPRFLGPFTSFSRFPDGPPVFNLPHRALPPGSRLPEPEALASSTRMPEPEALASSSRTPEPKHLPPSFRLPEPEASPSGSPSADASRRDKRPLIDDDAERKRVRKDKNRASAARSRERLRAYTAELEREVDYLTEANEQLRRKTTLMQLEAAEQDSIKRWFGRAASPPF